ncbi:MAG: tRNA dihydrouridine synthase DusB [Pseudomonadota bacterium]
MKRVVLKNHAISPPVLLAPLAGITDRPFRDLVMSFGAGQVVSEMIATRDMIAEKPSAQARAELGFGAAQTSVQIAGCEAGPMADCARLCADLGAAVIDINMGCPAKKVTNGYSGSALMRAPDVAVGLIEAVVRAVEVPVTVKMRLGWDDQSRNAAQIARAAEAAGVTMVTVHGRTRDQFYKGHADWAAIAPVVGAVSIPVIANGDVVDSASAKRALVQSGAAGVMVGRGAQGRPWRLAQIAADLFGTPAPRVPTGAALLDMIAAHTEAMLSFYGAELGNRVARKHLGCYMDDLQTPGDLRRRILTERDPAKVLDLVMRLNGGRAWAA